jgi:hypothetical protein
MSRSGVVSFNKFLCVELRVSFKVVVKFLLPFIFTSITFAQFNYPLHVGDYWEYTSGKRIITGDTLMSNEKSYFIFKDNTVGISFERQESSKVYVYDTYLQKEILYFDFTKDYYQIVSTTVIGSDTLDIFCGGNAVYNIFGKDRIRYTFVYDVRNWLDEEIAYYVTDSLGITGFERIAWSWAEYLTGAIINGVRYGNPSVSVKEDFQPMNYMLSQNYPNPFNPTTNITINLPNSHHTTLKVYNILGKEVETLINEKLESGQHYVTWNAKNFPSGLYYYRLISGDFIETKKMVLVK